MAKWGETDERWIVEERADSTNVNNWHWKEMEWTSNSKKTLNELFLNANLFHASKKGEATVTEIKVNGESHSHVRRGKVSLSYDFNLLIKIKGKIREGKYNATISIPEFSDDQYAKDIEMNIQIDSFDNKLKTHLRSLLLDDGKVAIISILMTYLKSWLEEADKKMILPAKNATQADKNAPMPPTMSMPKFLTTPGPKKKSSFASGTNSETPTSSASTTTNITAKSESTKKNSNTRSKKSTRLKQKKKSSESPYLSWIVVGSLTISAVAIWYQWKY